MTTQLPENFNQPFGFRNTPQDLLYRFPPSYLRPSKLERAAPHKDTPPTVFIFSPSEDQRITTENVVVKGYAFTDIWKEIERVELSTDGGKTWQQADLSPNPQPGEWRLWRKHLTLTPGQYTLVVRAADNLSDTDPTGVDLTWHQVRFEVTA